MDINWYGQACFRLKGKSVTVVVDPFDPEFTGIKLPKDLEADVVCISHDHGDHNFFAGIKGSPIKVEGDGEYDIKGAAILGVSTFHDKAEGSDRGKNTVYNIQIDNLNIIHLGDLGHELSQQQVDEIGLTDILLVPVGGVYTIDAKEASEIVSALEPRIIIPMHYGGVEGLKFPLEDVSNFLKEMGVEEVAPQVKLSITKEKLPEEPQVIVLSKTN